MFKAEAHTILCKRGKGPASSVVTRCGSQGKTTRKVFTLVSKDIDFAPKLASKNWAWLSVAVVPKFYAKMNCWRGWYQSQALL